MRAHKRENYGMYSIIVERTANAMRINRHEQQKKTREPDKFSSDYVHLNGSTSFGRVILSAVVPFYAVQMMVPTRQISHLNESFTKIDKCSLMVIAHCRAEILIIRLPYTIE